MTVSLLLTALIAAIVVVGIKEGASASQGTADATQSSGAANETSSGAPGTPGDEGSPTPQVQEPKIDLNNIPEGPYGDAVKEGLKLMNETNTLLPDYVGNKLSCSSCHGNGGLDGTSPYVGVAAAFPQYISRSGKVLTLEDRINGCMLRSMNGKAIPYNSDEMRAMVSYLTYISEGVPVGTKDRPWIQKNRVEAYKNMPEPPSLVEAEALYQQACAACHGQDGQGTGPMSGPALWGPDSFNLGAGMARIGTAAGYIKRNMPIGQMGGIQQGELTDEQATMLAAYILSHDRPDFPGKVNDWPNGDAPDDAAYLTKIDLEQGLTLDNVPWYKAYAERAVEAAKKAK
ncbi:MAG: Cytochrome c family protein [Candidatus Carbobacillus altaicus]|uniref:Cytochrome c family protein n=1 Tax=Candidatus Carbonibacillus altaicus TaxID=2163959 RepID=A0A2R6Y290_9BACL|nr:MAG: Cytochrome c family protein [Candidatus Carbobacillus altaicus]